MPVEAIWHKGDAVPRHVELSFASVRSGRLEEARATWQAALRLPSVRVYDSAAKQRASVPLGAFGDAG